MTEQELEMMAEMATEYNEWLKELDYQAMERMDDEWR